MTQPTIAHLLLQSVQRFLDFLEAFGRFLLLGFDYTGSTMRQARRGVG
jgi:hypothetical protein